VTFSRTMPMKYAHERTLGRPSCPRCGVLVVVPETSAYVSEDLVRHAWSCADCSYDFHTLVKLPVRRVA
jgi:transposase-like protein